MDYRGCSIVRDLKFRTWPSFSQMPNATVIHNPYNVRRDARPAWPTSTPDWRLACVARLDPVAKGQAMGQARERVISLVPSDPIESFCDLLKVLATR